MTKLKQTDSAMTPRYFRRLIENFKAEANRLIENGLREEKDPLKVNALLKAINQVFDVGAVRRTKSDAVWFEKTGRKLAIKLASWASGSDWREIRHHCLGGHGVHGLGDPKSLACGVSESLIYLFPFRNKKGSAREKTIIARAVVKTLRDHGMSLADIESKIAMPVSKIWAEIDDLRSGADRP